MIVEYKNGDGKKELRDTIVGKKESERRKQYMLLMLPLITAPLKAEFGDIFRIKVVGSTNADMAKPESDIDLSIIINDGVAEYLVNLLTVNFYRVVDNISKQQNEGYRIDLWFNDNHKDGNNKERY